MLQLKFAEDITLLSKLYEEISYPRCPLPGLYNVLSFPYAKVASSIYSLPLRLEIAREKLGRLFHIRNPEPLHDSVSWLVFAKAPGEAVNRRKSYI